MTRGKRTTALALAGAVALASGAYALGSQAGDGSAVAAKTANGPGYGPPPGGGPGRWGGDKGPGERLSGLADRLGVSEAALRKALTDLGRDKRDDMAQKLADALGIDVATVQSAFDKVRPKRDARPPRDRNHDDFAAALAKQLNLSDAKVKAALEKQRDHRGDPSALAGALGVSTAKLRQALATVFKDHRPGPRGGPGRPGFGPGVDALAEALGVTPAKLRAAFEKLRDEQTDAFAAALAKKLNVDPAKVKDALQDAAPFGFGRHHP